VCWKKKKKRKKEKRKKNLVGFCYFWVRIFCTPPSSENSESKFLGPHVGYKNEKCWGYPPASHQNLSKKTENEFTK
jgi:hypothetical protein